MDRGKKTSSFLGSLNNRMYLDLKDIIREHTLSYLPAKSLFKFRAVCRDWNLQISTPFFAHSQSICFRQVSGFFYQSSMGPLSFLSTDPVACNVPDPSLKFLPEEFDIRASSNGLLCCQARYGERCYYICNPVTKQYKKLPKSSADHGLDPSVVLIFEPSLLNFMADYKLVCAFTSADFDGATEFDIYSSSDDSWRVSAEICFASKKLVPKSGVYADGVVYWQAKAHGIVAFDLKKERTQLIRDYHGYNSTMGSMDGKLCAAYVNANSISVNVLCNVYTNTMQMQSKTEAWKIKTCFNLDWSLFRGHGSDQLAVLYVGGDMVLAQAGQTIICFDMKTRENKVVCSDAGFATRFFPYVNSLVCI